MTGDRSTELYERARHVSPGGVHGAARYYAPHPTFFQRMEGAYVWDVDGRKYLDLHGCFGPAALGHNDPAVRAAVEQALAEQGVLFGTPHEHEVELSETLIATIPCAEVVALCGGGGSDALYFGYRLARSTTGRRRLLKFEGEYHGWHDPLAVSVRPDPRAAGDGDRPLPVPLSSGAAEGAEKTVIGRLNDVELLERLFAEHGSELACAAIEPVCHSSGCIPIDVAFLERLRALCDEHGVVLMFDEILTGFRHSLGGAQSMLGVIPDIAAFGKAMANGFPISALVGRRDIMQGLSPTGDAFYSGTFNAHLLSVMAAQATIAEMERRRIHEHTAAIVGHLTGAINEYARELDVPAVCQSFGAIYCVYFGVSAVREYRDVAGLMFWPKHELDHEYRQALLDANIFMHPYSCNRCFVSACHTLSEIERIADVTREFIRVHRDEIVDQEPLEPRAASTAVGRA